jgi:N-methylhydantoinase B
MIDPIALEVLRFRLESICEQAGLAIERTSISPIVVEARDYGVTICDPNGNLIVGAGAIKTHFFAAANTVQATLKRHAGKIGPGDVFAANDPHNGGGMHPQDVVILRPVFSGDRLAAWIASIAHMMDMGGMVPGSFAPLATECYQEAFRFPPVRLMRDGKEEADVWAILFNNIRLADLVELDLRGLIAGCNVACEQLTECITESGADTFSQTLAELCDRSEQEFRNRIGQLERGVYEAAGWSEWNEELYRVPCRLIVEDRRLIFDFEGASPQTPHFFNSKPFIIKSHLAVEIANYLGQDLPYNDGLSRVYEVRCPEGSIVNC